MLSAKNHLDSKHPVRYRRNKNKSSRVPSWCYAKGTTGRVTLFGTKANDQTYDLFSDTLAMTHLSASGLFVNESYGNMNSSLRS